MNLCSHRSIGLALVSILLAAPSVGAAPKEGGGLWSSLRFRYVGPVGNRVSAVVGVPGDTNTAYAGAASGGVWKTEDAGVTWKPVFDEQTTMAIGALAVAPSDPNVVWAGTGETWIRSNISIGDGIYRSTDAGRSWQRMGLEKSARIGRIVIHPDNPEIVFAAALGHGYGPQPDRGVYRTKDGGKTWDRVLFVDESTGAIDLVMDPNNPRILFAGMWQFALTTWSRDSGGPGSGLYVSRDGGDTWEKLQNHGLPKEPWGKIGLAISAADSQKVYALIETSSNRDFAPVEEKKGVLWRSNDGGEHWRLVSSNNDLVQRPLYYSRMAASPDNASELRFMSVSHQHSIDGGSTVEEVDSGWDHHDIWIDPKNADRILLGYDGGVALSTNRGKSWARAQLPIAQMYHVAVDDQIPYFLYGNRQDGGSYRGPSNTLTEGSIPIGAWQSVGGCESGFAIPDPSGSTVFSGCYDGILERWDRATNTSQNVMVWPEPIESLPASAMKYRFQWTFPILRSPHDPQTVYVGSQFVHVSKDGGLSWQTISPDLTKNEPEKQKRSGGLTPDDASPTVAPVIFALAEAPQEEGVLWAGTNDGQVHVTRDGGKIWKNVTANLPGLPKDGTVSNIEPSPYTAGTCYLTVDRHQLGDTEPYVYRTTNYGTTWKRIVNGIPVSLHSYAHVVREDPARPNLLYLGTENGLYASWDAGDSWHALQGDLPHAPVHWLEVQKRFGDLVVATYGRGFFILDDLSVVRQWKPELEKTEAHLFTPRDTYRFRTREAGEASLIDLSAGMDPRYGAQIVFHLAEKPGEDDELALEILDVDGNVVRTFEHVEGKKGFNRVQWNLRSDESTQPKLRVKAVEAGNERIPERGWRKLSEGEQYAPLVLPGSYTVRLRVGPKDEPDELTAAITVLRDPGLPASDADLAAQHELLTKGKEKLDRLAKSINELEWMRRQLEDLRTRLADREDSDAAARDVKDRAKKLDEEIQALENELYDLRLTEAGQDNLRWPRKLFGRLLYWIGYTDSTDAAPTASQREVYELLSKEIAAFEEKQAAFKAGPLADFNQSLREKDWPYLVAEREKE